MKSILKSAVLPVAASFALVLSAQAADHPMTKAGRYIDDSVITTQVKAKYVENPIVDATGISVKTRKGVVHLTGTAKTAAEKDDAGNIAKTIDGVKKVENDIVVKK